MLSLFQIRAIKISSRSTSVYQKIRAGDKGPPVAHQQFGHIRHLVGRAGTMRRTLGEHLLIELPTYPVELIKCQWSDDNSRRNGIQDGHLVHPIL